MHRLVIMSTLLAFAMASSSFTNQPIPSPVRQNPIDCVYGPWTPYTQCTESCGKTGTQSRTRRILSQAQFGGSPCDPSLLEEWQQCFTPCAVDCVMEAWGPWSVCHVNGGQQCGVGRRSRTRGVLVQPQNGGRQCGEREQWETCDAGPCPRDCALGNWGSWSQCPSCGQADRSRQRQILVDAAFGGRQCDVNGLSEVETCQISPCAVDCVMGPWSQYTQCQSNNGQTCGQGSRSRQRSILVQSQFGGRQCEQTQQIDRCDLGPCPIDCVMNQWNAWNRCQTNDGRPCGSGRRSRQRSILVQSQFGGRQCEQTEASEVCDLGSCPVDCVMSTWGPFGACSAQCGSGTKSRFRSILVPAQFGGTPCERTQDVTTCEDKPCFDPPSCIGRPTEFYINPAEPCSPSYWKCINEETHANVCPSGLVFNIQSFRCESRSQVPACF